MTEVTRRNAKAFETLELRLKELSGLQMKVGWFENNRYENGTPVATAAAASEFGVPSRSIPPRPFLRPTVTNKQKSWVELAARGAKAILAGHETGRSVLEKLGQQVVGDIQDSIEAVHSPPLSNITLQLRRWRKDGRIITGATVGEAAEEVNKPGWKKPNVSDKPLIETARMRDTVTYVVEDSE